MAKPGSLLSILIILASLAPCLFGQSLPTHTSLWLDACGVDDIRQSEPHVIAKLQDWGALPDTTQYILITRFDFPDDLHLKCKPKRVGLNCSNAVAALRMMSKDSSFDSVSTLFVETDTLSESLVDAISSLPSITHLTLSFGLHGAKASFAKMVRLPSLTYLSLLWTGSDQLTMTGFSALEKLKVLSVLGIGSCSEQTFKDICSSNSISALDVSGLRLPGDYSLLLQRMSHLTILSLPGATDGGQALDFPYSSLQSLRSIKAPSLDLKDVQNLDSLEELVVYRTLSSSMHGGAVRLPGLRYLDVSMCNFSGVTIDAFAKCNKLEYLSISGSRGVDGDSLTTLLSATPHIVEIDISHTDLGSSVEAWLPEKVAAKLLVLRMAFCRKVKEACLTYIACAAKALQVFVLQGVAELTVAALRKVSMLRQLLVLDVSGQASLSDDILKQYAENLMCLQQLSIMSSPLVTDEGVEALLAIKSLQQITLEGCTQVGDSIRRKLSDSGVVVD